VLDITDGNAQQHHRRTVKALMNPHNKENWKNSINKGGLIELTIAEQQKTFNLFTQMCQVTENTKAPPLLPSTSFAPLRCGLGTGNHKTQMLNLNLLNSAKRPDLSTL
jgi:hypothetical protein